MKTKTDTLVIGGGAIGICAAYYLWSNGISVRVIERAEIGSGCSLHNAGFVSPSHFIPLASPGVMAKGLKWLFQAESPFYIKPRFDLELFSWLWRFFAACSEKHMRRAMPVLRDLSLGSVGLFKELSTVEGIEFAFQNRGLFMLYNSEKGKKENLEMAQLAHELGVEARALTAGQINDLEPELHTCARGGVYYPQDSHLNPSLFLQSVGTYLARRGVDIHTGTEVVGFEHSGKKITGLKTSRGEFRADEVILAAGSWSPQIIRLLKLSLPIQPAKGYSVTVQRPARKLLIPSILTEAKVAITPIGDSLRFAGTLELAGLDLSVNMRRVNAILRAVPNYIPNIAPGTVERGEVWAGLRPCSPDGLPYIGRLKAFDNLIAATGHAMLGISLAPITGKLISDLVLSKTPSIDLSALRVDRFR